jgi:sugar lactone lactonase YvrE
VSEVRDTDAGSVPFEIVADYACETGENPRWHEREQRLYWTDIPRADGFVITRRAKSTSNVTRADRWVASRSKWTGPYSYLWIVGR